MTSAQRKLARGVEHVQTLRAEARAFENSQPYVLRTEREERSPQEVVYTCFAVERQAPPDHWPLLAGEAIQNLRSALEYAVHAASGYWEWSQYPIFTEARSFKKKGRPMISRVPEPIRTLIEGQQPYATLPERPDLEPLARLSYLSNLDKHRELSTVAAAVNFPFFGHSVQDLHAEFTDVGEGRSLHEGAQVMQFVVYGDEATQVQVNPDMAYHVCVEGLTLAETLAAITNRVFEVVTEIETGTPAPGIARYPVLSR